MTRTAAIAGILLLTGCAEGVRVQSYPSGAALSVNGRLIGETPTVAWVSRAEWTGRGIPYRAEKDGYEPAEGTFDVCVSGGRVTGGLFTLGFSLLFKPPRTFCTDPQIVRLTPKPFGTDPRAR